jgi:mono/diheme cytochrome c family protein
MSNRPAARLALALTLAACLSLFGSVRADPASSPQSAWRGAAVKSDPSLKDPLVRRGKEVFDARCRACHGQAYSTGKAQSDGALALQVPGTYALGLRYKGQKPALLEERTDLTPEVVAIFVRRGGGGFMPPFRPTEVSDEDLKALGAYLARKR